MQPGHYMSVKSKFSTHSTFSGGKLEVFAALRIDVKTNKYSDDLFLRLDALAKKPEVMRGLMREVALQHLITRYQQRFTAAEDRMKEIFTMSGSTNRESPDYDHSADVRFIRAKEARIRNLRRRAAGKGPSVQAAVERQVDAINDAIVARLEGSKTQGRGGGKLPRELAEALGLNPDAGSIEDRLQSAGSFTATMKQVYAALFSKSWDIAGPTVGIGFGDIATLEGIKTPSKHPTSSPYNTMWKQLEFGTGVFAVEAGGPLARTSGEWKDDSGDGSWWYGGQRNGKFTGIRFKGTRPGSWYRTPQGTPYNSDTTLFMSAFYSRLLRYIRGQ